MAMRDWYPFYLYADASENTGKTEKEAVFNTASYFVLPVLHNAHQT